MLGKLIKYEFRATKKFMFLAYTLFFVMSLILGVGSRIDTGYFESNSILGGMGELVGGLLTIVFVVAYIAVNCVVFAGMFFLAINRFRHNILGNEGYLMHTLPVKSGDHILAKTFVCVTWTVCSFIVAALSYFVLFLISYGDGLGAEFRMLYEQLYAMNVDVSAGYVYLLEYFVVALVSVTAGYLQIYASMALGYSVNSNRTLLSIAAYIGINIGWSIVESIISLPLSGVSAERLLSSDGVHVMLLVTFISALLKSVVCYYVANFFLNKKLNLQ